MQKTKNPALTALFAVVSAAYIFPLVVLFYNSFKISCNLS